jgi:hypothetical protein
MKMTEMMSSKMGGVRLRAARSGADAHFIAEQMTLSALEFAEPGVPFGLASQVSEPETQRRWRESCVAKVAGSLAPGAAASTRLWIAEDPRDGSIVGSIGIHPDLGADKGSSYVAEAVRARLPVGVEPPGDLQLGELVCVASPAARPLLLRNAGAFASHPRRFCHRHFHRAHEPTDRASSRGAEHSRHSYCADSAMSLRQVLLRGQSRPRQRRRRPADGDCPGLRSTGRLRGTVSVRVPGSERCGSSVPPARLLHRRAVRLARPARSSGVRL